MEGQKNLLWYDIEYFYEVKEGFARLADTLQFKKKGMCTLCNKRKKTHIHHIVPLSSGGANHKDNIIEVCILCHNK